MEVQVLSAAPFKIERLYGAIILNFELEGLNDVQPEAKRKAAEALKARRQFLSAAPFSKFDLWTALRPHLQRA